ncbi:MAG: IS481 family transposase [Actinomycetota bacterium]|nr:IS481 family transposase [Actinomycetota bacterium]
MKLHGNAALSLNARRRMARRVVEQRWSLAKAARAAEVSERTCSKWVGRFRVEGEAGLLDRSSAPRRIPHRTPEDRVEAIAALRRLRMTGAEIAFSLGMALSTVSAVLTRIGLGKLSRLEPPEPPNRYERRRAGELLHVDVKKLGKIRVAGHRVTAKRTQRRTTYTPDGRRIGDAGWEFVHVCVDDATRLAYVEVLSDEKAITAAGFLRRAVAFYGRHGISVERVMSDNGACYRSTIHALACRALGLRHLRTRPYRPRTNGKAERFIRTLVAGWAYGAIYATSTERTAALHGWLWTYNHQRPHGALSHKPPIDHLNKLNNLPGSYN